MPLSDVDYQLGLEKAYSGNLTKVDGGYVEVPTFIFTGKIDLKMKPLPEIDFFVKDESGQIKRVRTAGDQFSPLALSAYPIALVQEKDLDQIKDYARNKILAETMNASSLPTQERIEHIRKAAISIVGDLFEDPSPENISKSKQVVSSFVYVLMRDPSAFLLLANLRSHDPYTLQHSVGAAVNAVILSRKVGVKDERELVDVGMGGLLHDIGKTKVKKEIINKPGPLNDEEWAEMQKHSLWGWEIIKNHPDLSDRTKRAVLEHHEEKTGKGYPHQRVWSEVDLFSKIVGISDIFNALTTNRSYSKARTPFEAFELMKDKIYHKFDLELFKALVKIYGGQVDDLK